MAKKLLFLGVLVWLLAAAGPEVASAGVDPLASPTPRPTERITAPVISGINPDVVLSEGIQGDTHPSDSFNPMEIELPLLVQPPDYIDLDSQPASNLFPLSSPARNFNDVNCGPQALSQALAILDPEKNEGAPAANQLTDFLADRGLMYDWGTGVEELVYAAREFGYGGSFLFKNWDFEQLAEYLRKSSPVVVPLGSNGEERSGHFVVLTGISEDGQRIYYQDPGFGVSVLSKSDFRQLWEIQGNAGMIPQTEAPFTADPMLPWFGLFGAISALALILKLPEEIRFPGVIKGLRKKLDNPWRQGIGAGPLPPEEAEVIRVPRYEVKTVYRGIKTVEVEVPVYVTKRVKVGLRGIKKQVPQYETRRIQVGIERITKRVPVYITQKIRTGTRWVKKEIPVTRYKTKKVLVWKKYTTRVPVYKRIGSKKFIVRYQNEVRWKKVPVCKQVPYQSTKTISVQVPVYQETKVISGYKTVTEKVPKFEQKRVLVGHKTIQQTLPVFEDRQVQVGTKTVKREMPVYEKVNVVTGYDELPNHQENSLDVVEQKMKLICDDEKIKELIEGKNFEVTDAVYLKGGPGAGSGLEKVENSWSGYSGGGGECTWWMYLLKLGSSALVWARDATNLLEGPARKPDAQAIIMLSGAENDIKIDHVVVLNKGNESLIVRYINIKNAELISSSEETYIQVYPYRNDKQSFSEMDMISPGDYKIFEIDQTIKLSSDVLRTLLIQFSTLSNRSGFLIHEMSVCEE
jgi:ribosomal protein S7